MKTVHECLQEWSLRAPRTSASIGQGHGEGDGARWHTLADLVSDIRPLAQTVADIYGAGLPLGGSFLVARVARAVVEPSLFSLGAVGAAPPITREEVAFHLGDDGRVAGIEFASSSGGAHDAASFANEILRTFDPVVVAFREAIPLGRRGIWGLVADAVGGAAVALHRTSPSALDLAADVLAHLDASCGVPSQAAWVVGDGVAEQQRRSCCLAFQLDGHGYCDTCPVGRRGEERRAGALPL